MTIPTRDELIERVRNIPRLHKWPTAEEVADLLDAEIRRAVAEELQVLRDGAEVEMNPYGARHYVPRYTIDARLTALRAEQAEHDKPGAASSETAGSQPARAEQPPALSDADWLAMMRHIALHLGDEADRDFAGDAEFGEQFDPWECVRKAGLKLRAASAPKPVDVFAAIKAERAVQDAKWGGPEHDDTHGIADWSSYIKKHVGRLDVVERPENQEAALVRVAALAVAAIESLRRRQRAQKASR